MIKPIMNKLKRLLTISLSLAIILTFLPTNTVDVHAEAKYISFQMSSLRKSGSWWLTQDIRQPYYEGVGVDETLRINFEIDDYSSKCEVEDGIFKPKDTSFRLSLFTPTDHRKFYQMCKMVLVGDNGATITVYRNQFSIGYSQVNYVNLRGDSRGKVYVENIGQSSIYLKEIRIYYHDLEAKSSAATCTTAGYKTYYKCKDSGCNRICTENNVFKPYIVTPDTYGKTGFGTEAQWKSANPIAALGHNYSVLQSDANQHWYKCSRCTATNTKVNHSGGTATCTSQAVCSTCKKAYGSALGHKYRTTWTYDGNNHWHQCERCGAKKDNGTHSGGTATCTQLAKCSTCGKEYGTVSGHSLEHKDAQAAHCSQDGWKEYWECSVCHDVYANAQGTGTKYTEISWKDGAGKVGKNNDHLWSYAVNGNTITATCSRNEEEHTASISISANNAEYTGSAYAGVDETAWTNSSLGLTIPTVNYIGRDGTTYGSTTAPTNAGKYTTQITAGTVTASSNFEITPREVELNWHNTTVTYNGTAQTPTATVINKANTTDEVTVNVTGTQTNAGTYTATASSLTGASADNYTLPTNNTHPFVIEPKAIGLTTITSTYNNINSPEFVNESTQFTQTITIVDYGAQLGSGDYNVTGTTSATLPGLYTVTITGIGNYTGTTNIEWEVKAKPIHNTDLDVTGYYGTYDGASHTITVSPKAGLEGAIVSYKTGNDNDYSLTNPSFKDAGSYTVYYKVTKTGHADYEDSSTVIISHKEVTIGWSDTDLTYIPNTSQKPTATVTNKVNGDVVNVTVSGAETKAGTYTAVASGLYGDNSENYVLNYKLPIVEPSTTFTIKKAKVDAPTADSTEFTYNDSEQTYTLATSELYTISNNTRTLAGTQTVSVALVDKDNYEWNVEGTDDQKVADREYAFTINKATVTIPTKDSTTYTYNEQPQTYGLTETSDYTVSNSTHTNAGTYEVDAILKDHNNYMWSDGTIDNQKYNFVIHKAEVTAPDPLTTTFIYNTNAQTYNLPTNNDVYTISNNTHTNAGTYKVDVVLKDNKNYKWSGTELDYKEYTFTINKKTVTIPSVDQTVYTYDGTEKVYSPIVVSAETNLYDILNNKHYNAGTYTVSAVLKDKENYEWNDAQATTAEQKIANRTYTFTIDKAKVTKPNENTSEFIFNRNVQTCELATSSLYSISNNMRTNAGSQTVTVYLNDKSNYEWDHITSGDKTVDQEYTFEIKPLDISETATISLDHAYYEFTGLEKVAHVSKVTDGVVDIIENEDFDISGNKATVPGTHTLTAMFKGNYTGSKSIDWLIVEDVQHTQNVELPKEGNYVGELELVVTGDDEVPEIKLENPMDLLNPEDLEKLKEGSSEYDSQTNKRSYYIIELILSLNAREEEHVHQESLAAIEEIIGDQTGTHYYDISIKKVIKKIEETKAANEEESPTTEVISTTIESITNSPDEIEITLNIPEEIPAVKAGYSRKYSMFRSHNFGTTDEPDYKADVLDVEVKDNKLAFTSKLFSDYVLAYKDTLIPRHDNGFDVNLTYIAPNTSVR